jgi:hypothetical protein
MTGNDREKFEKLEELLRILEPQPEYHDAA